MSRSSIAVRNVSKKFISTFFAATLALGLVPATAFAENDEPTGDESSQNVISSEVAEGNNPSYVISSDSEKSALPEQNEAEGLTSSRGEDTTMADATGSEDAMIIPAATERINETMALQTRTVAQAESTRSYFLAQTLESTRTVPIVSANLPLDTGNTDVIDNDGEASEDEGGEDSDDPDSEGPNNDVISTEGPQGPSGEISLASTVIGSFTYDGITYAVEPGGETVAVVAADYKKLPEKFIENQVIVLPSMATADGIDYRTVSRIADNAFASLTKENASPDYKGCEALFSNEELLAEAGIDAAEVEAFLNPEQDMIDIDGDGEADTPANPLKDCTGVLALGIPASVTFIADDAFVGFDTLQYLVVSEDNPSYASYDGALYDADLTNLRLIPEGRVGAVRVAPSATDVAPEAFSHCPSVTTLVADPESEVFRFFNENEEEYLEHRNRQTQFLFAEFGHDNSQWRPFQRFVVGYMRQASRLDPSSMIMDSKTTYSADESSGTLYCTYIGDFRYRIGSAVHSIYRFDTFQDSTDPNFSLSDGTWCMENKPVTGGPSTKTSQSGFQLIHETPRDVIWYFDKYLGLYTVTTLGSGRPMLSIFFVDGKEQSNRITLLYDYSEKPIPIEKDGKGSKFTVGTHDCVLFFSTGYDVTWDAHTYGGSIVSDGSERETSYSDATKRWDLSGEQWLYTTGLPPTATVKSPEGFTFKGWASQAKDADGNPRVDSLGNKVLNDADYDYRVFDSSTSTISLVRGYLTPERLGSKKLIVEENTTFYAVFEANIEFDAGRMGGSFSETLTNVRWGDKLETPTVTAPVGWHFQGWCRFIGGTTGNREDATTTVEGTTINYVIPTKADAYHFIWGMDVVWKIDQSDGGSTDATTRFTSPSGASGRTEYTQENVTGWKQPLSEWPSVSPRKGYVLEGWKSKSTVTGVDDAVYPLSAAVPVVKTPTTFSTVWSAAEFTVTFDPNIDGKSSASQAQTFDAELKTLPTGAARDDVQGFRFAGYFDAAGKQYYDSNGNPCKDATGATLAWDKAGDTTLYAHWKYRIIFDKNHDEAKASLPAGAVQADGTVKVTLTGGTGDESILIYDYDSDTPYIWATWHGKDASKGYPRTYLPGAARANYPSDGSSAKSFSPLSFWSYADGTKSVAADAALADENAFDAHLSSDATGKYVMLTADWKAAAAKYDVRLVADTPFAGEGGVAGFDVATVTNDDVRTKTLSQVPYGSMLDEGATSFPVTVPLAKGEQHVRFAGYYAVKNASETDTCYIDEYGDATHKLDRATLTDGAVELYARWVAAEYTVTFQLTDADAGQDGKTPDALSGILYDADMPDLSWADGGVASSKVPSRSGFEFRGYFDEDGIQYYDEDLNVISGAKWGSAPGATTLYARWTYEVNLHMNLGGAGTTASEDAVSATDGTAMKAQGPTSQILHMTATERTSDDYDGFSFSDDVSADNVVPTGLVRTRDGKETGYAFRGFTLVKDDETILIDDAWMAGAGNPSDLLPGSAGPVTLFALWEAKPYTVSLEASDYDGFAYAGLPQDVTNEATRATSATATYDAPFSGSIVVPNMKGYAFLGYFDAPQTVPATSDGTSYDPGATMYFDRYGDPQSAAWDTAANGQLYAHYYQVPYTLSFSAPAGVTGTTSDVTVFYGYDLGSAPNHMVHRKGYELLGWNTKADGTGVDWFDANGDGKSGIKYLTAGDTTLYPRWEGKTYSITWMFGYDHQGKVWNHVPDGNGIADGAMTTPVAPKKYGYGDEVDVPDPTDYSIAYRFWGWYAGEDEAVAHNDPSKLASNVYFVTRGGKTYFEPSDDANCPSDVVLYAAYDRDPIDYTITLLAGDHGEFPEGDVRTYTKRWTGNAADDIDLTVEAADLSRTHAGWRQAGWKEVVGDGRVDCDTTVELGTGNRTFEMAWEIDAANPYTVTFSRGTVASDPSRPHDLVFLYPSKAGKPQPFNAGQTEEVAVPKLQIDGADVTETAGYAFDGWWRVGTDGNGSTVLAERLTKTSYTGQELADMAEAADTRDLVFAAKWAPKEFQVRYRYDAGEGAKELTDSAYGPVTVKYDDEVELASPAIEQTGATGKIFERWEGEGADTSKKPLYPGARLTVADLVSKVGTLGIQKAENAPDIVWLHAKWLASYNFCVPLTVNIAIDPDRKEGTKVGEAWIETKSTTELFVESVSLTRATDLGSKTLQAKGTDRSSDVYLTVVGDGTEDATPLKMNLGAGSNVHRDLAEHGLGTLKANGGKPSRINVTYDLELKPGSGLTFRDFENLAKIRDAYQADGTLAAKTVGRVFYTVSMVPPKTTAATE